MNLVHFLLFTFPLLFISATPARLVPASVLEIHLGLMEATVGVNPQTGRPSGWYTSDVTLPVLAPANVLTNGKPFAGGRITISEEGLHQVEFQVDTLGQTGTVTQFVSIDKTPPLITWQTKPNTTISGYGALSAEITDPISGICVVEASLDAGRTWDDQFWPAPDPGQSGSVHETIWARHLTPQEIPPGKHLLTLRAHDCAGNTSPSQSLVFWVE